MFMAKVIMGFPWSIINSFQEIMDGLVLSIKEKVQLNYFGISYHNMTLKV